MCFFITVFVLLSANGFSQNGYLGNKNSLYFEFYGRPTFEKTHRLNNAKTYSKTMNRFAFSSYAIGLSHVKDEILEFNLKYRFVNGYAPIKNSIFVKDDAIYETVGSGEVSRTLLNFLEDPKINLHFYSVNFKHYRKGNIAPLGKYVGLEYEFGHGKLKVTDEIYIGKGYTAKPNNALLVKRELIEKEVVQIRKQENGRIGGLYLLVGRTYPINDFLLFSCGAKLPMIRVVNINGYRETGFRAQKVGSYSYSNNSSFESVLSQIMGSHTRISFNLGIKLMF